MIYILGGKGFVGSGIGSYLKDQGITYQVIDRENYSEYVGTSCDVFINANGNSIKYLSDREPKWEFESSVTSVVKSVFDFSFSRYIYLSTCDVYNDCSPNANTSEDQVIDISKSSRYGFHKYLAEQYVRFSCPQYTIIRMGGFVGEGLKKNAIFDLLNGDPLWVGKNSKLQFMDTYENGRIIYEMIARNLFLNDTVNVCGSGTVEINVLCEKFNLPYRENKSNSNVFYEVDTNKVSGHIKIPSSKLMVENFLRSKLGDKL